MIDRWLAQEFEAQLKKPEIYRVLFFDERGEYEKIFKSSSSSLKKYEVAFYEGSLLKLKYKIEMEDEKKKWIVYLPIPRKDADYLKEYEFTSYIFEKPIYSYLRKKGVKFPSDKDEEESIKNILSILAFRSIGKDKSFWEGLTREKVTELIFPEFHKQVLEFIKGPDKNFEKLKKEGLLELFLDKIKIDFGVPPFGNDEAGVHTLLENFLAEIFLTEAYFNLGNPENFPYSDHVKKNDEEQKRIISFLESWSSNINFIQLFKEKAKKLEEKYNLAEWAKCLPLENHKSFGFPGVAKASWELFIKRANSISEKNEFIQVLKKHEELIHIHSKAFWARQEETSGWSVCKVALNILRLSEMIEDNLGKSKSIKYFLEKYTTEWWKFDRSYRQFKMALSKTKVDLDPINHWVKFIYHDIVQKMNSLFADEVEKLKDWNLSNKKQKDFWKNFMQNETSKIGVFFVDALRYELGKELEEILKQEYKVEADYLIAEIPTETLVGMSMLLPNRIEPKLFFEKDAIVLKENDKTTIRNKEDRKIWLKEHVSDVHFVELRELVEPKFKQFKENLLVVFSVELDALGASLGTSSLALFNELLGYVERGVKKAFELGVEKVFIISDHGFLLLEDIKEIEKIELKQKGILIKSERYAIGENLRKGNHLKFMINKDERLDAIFPRGIYCFKAPGRYDFLHGGLTLQEVVIPLVKVERYFKPSKVAVAIGISKDLKEGIRNQIFKVILAPEAEDLFAKQLRTARSVRVYCEKSGSKVSNEAVEIVKDQEVEVTLRIEAGVKKGKITIKAVDDETLELLDSKEVDVYLEFEIDI